MLKTVRSLPPFFLEGRFQVHGSFVVGEEIARGIVTNSVGYSAVPALFVALHVAAPKSPTIPVYG